METTPQPLDSLMTRLSLTNADLVRASTEQLTFKMVQKGRKGRRLTPHIQEKILNAILKMRPELKFRRRELFHYPMDAAVVQKIDEALALIAKKKIKYPQFIDLLAGAGVHHYAVSVAANEITFYGSRSEARVLKGAAISLSAPGRFDEAVLRSAIDAAQKETIDHPTFLKKIHDAGIASYETNLYQRVITYKGETEFYREAIPAAGAEPQGFAKPAEAAKAGPAKKKAAEPKRKTGVVLAARKAAAVAKKRSLKKIRPLSGASKKTPKK